MCNRQPQYYSTVDLGELRETKATKFYANFFNFDLSFIRHLSRFQYNANLKQTDHEGRTCLTYAKASNELARVKQSNNKPHHVTSG